ncbi:hypothetical protein SELMODRAFT_177978 [Selaginella moellendorffii]|uniref:UBR-type domain-containing protein n=1 Tax=Selaginella moellendorffii TaxID=88036 RepID=D8S990_SELML|nr:hypothetical protein SELMODRAFT_177978 [Selaginella moellendorffii]
MEEESEVMTIEEFLENQEAEEESADLVFGGDEGKECTYNEGYMPRQAVFSCLSCAPQGNAGICTACSLACHDGHEIVELWTKRNFRCDCGNSKFGGKDCKLWKEKDAENKENAYNQNFVGLYCICHRQHPNPEDEHLGEMLQCCICEDWFHEAHLGLLSSEKVPRDEDNEPLFDELICQNCVGRCSFLFRYQELLIPPGIPDETHPVEQSETSTEAPANVAVEQTMGSKAEKSDALTSGKKEEGSVSNGVSDVAGCSQSSNSICKLKPANVNAETGNCFGKALFLERSWRTSLCQCDSCVELYKTRGLSFLLDKLDTLQSYEALAKERRKTRMEQAEGASMKLLNNLDHVAKVEFLHGLNDMTSELSSFLVSGDFRDTGKTVTSADVYEFFDRLKKRRKL